MHLLALLVLLPGFLLAATTTAQATNVTNNKAPISRLFTNPCNGERWSPASPPTAGGCAPSAPVRTATG